MGKNFKRFKRKTRLNAIISSIMLGLGVGIVSAAVIMLVFKLTGNDPTLLYYAFSAVGAVVFGVGMYFILMPSDVRLASRLDKTYELDEKISTMIEFQNENSDFILLQREDADEKLGEKPMKQFKSKHLIAAVLVFTISLGCMAGAWFIPAKAEETETPISEFDKEWLITALRELIAMVDSSFMADSLKADVLTELNSLFSFVEGSVLMSEMKAEAIDTVNSIDRMLKVANSASSIGAEFETSADEYIAKLGKELSSLTGSGAKKALDNLAEHLVTLDSTDVSLVADEMTFHLSKVTASSDDLILMSFKTLAAKLRTGGSIKDLCKETGKEISNEIIVQYVNRTTVEDVVQTLCNLFGISKSDLAPDVSTLPDDNDRDPEDSGDLGNGTVDEPEGPIGSGGLGTGDVIYGSNDLIFDPDKNAHVPYGDVLNDYFAKANEQITDGRVSEEISDAAEEYFGALFGGSN